ncbi:MAG: SBBP repeat-containing protein, partial [Gammaproteobacteria bacterium]|nr:SBBP repeat-containing protein [Gammaproteobacteria bacterium]
DTGKREIIEGRFNVMTDNHVGFEIAAYDTSKPLVIDPVLEFSTYFGGSGDDQAYALDIDIDGGIVVTGTTTSTDFPVLTPVQATKAGPADTLDGFVYKLDATGSTLIYATYIGGSINDRPFKLEIDSTGSPVIVGYTESDDFPTFNAAQSVFGGGDEARFGITPEDGFVAKLSNTGSSLVFSTFLGGFDDLHPLEFVRGIDIDASNNIYVNGDTGSSNFPSTHDLEGRACLAGSDPLFDIDTDSFVAKYQPNGTLVFATCLGGTESRERGRGIAVAATGEIYLTGNTSALDFPVTAGAFQTVQPSVPPPVGPRQASGFITKLDATATSIIYSTYIGGSNSEFPEEIRVDSAGNAYITGFTDSENFPVTPGAFQTVCKCGSGGNPSSFTDDGFLVKLNPTGSALVYSSYFGGIERDLAWNLHIDSSGRANISGYTNSPDFPVVDPLQVANAGGNDAFVAVFSADGSALEFSTYIGGTADEFNFGAVALAPGGGIYLAGGTRSTDFPVLNPLQTANAGGEDTFVLKIVPDDVEITEADLSLEKISEPETVKLGKKVDYVLTVTNPAAGDVENVKVIDRLPFGISFVSATPEQGNCTFIRKYFSRFVVCELGTVAAESEVAITITGKAWLPGRWKNIAKVKTDLPDPDLTNNIAFAKTRVKFHRFRWWRR